MGCKGISVQIFAYKSATYPKTTCVFTFLIRCDQTKNRDLFLLVKQNHHIMPRPRKRSYPEPDAIEHTTVEREIDKHKTVVQRLHQVVESEEGRDILRSVVVAMDHAKRWTLLFMNHTYQVSDVEFDFSSKTQTRVNVALRFFVDQHDGMRVLKSNAKAFQPEYLELLRSLEAFHTQYPMSQKPCVLKIHHNIFNRISTQIKTMVAQYDEYLLDDERILSRLMKIVRSQTKLSNEERQAVASVISDELQGVKTPSERLRYIHKFQRMFEPCPNTYAEIWRYPTAKHGLSYAMFDKESLAALDVTCYNQGDALLSTDGYGASVTRMSQVTIQSRVVRRTKKRKKDDSEDPETFLVYRDPDPTGAFDAPTMKRVMNCKSVPETQAYLRRLTALEPEFLPMFKDDIFTAVDPGKHQIFTATVGDKIVNFSSSRYSHLLFTRKFTRDVKRLNESIRAPLDALSRTRTFMEYLETFSGSCDKITNVYQQEKLLAWRFRRYGLKQKIQDMMLSMLTEGSSGLSNFYLNDKKRKRQKIGRVEPKRLIVWGDGGRGHTRGCAPVPNVILLYRFSKRVRVVVAPEAYTSKTCCVCFTQSFTKQTQQRNGQRLRTCKTCFSVLDRDVNACLNIATVFQYYIRNGQKPEWQRKRETSQTNAA